MPESEKLIKYRQLIAEFKRLIAEFGWDSKEVEAHQDSMDDPWYELSDEERKILNSESD